MLAYFLFLRSLHRLAANPMITSTTMTNHTTMRSIMAHPAMHGDALSFAIRAHPKLSERRSMVRRMPILRVLYDGGPWGGTVGNRSMERPDGVAQVIVETGNSPIGHYELAPEKLRPSAGAEYRAIWVADDE
jgi:hypothetical protein